MSASSLGQLESGPSSQVDKEDRAGALERNGFTMGFLLGRRLDLILSVGQVAIRNHRQRRCRCRRGLEVR
jgi:hypothetical protein